jgi:acetoin utilization deacetylase AcuC-like enzyme
LDEALKRIIDFKPDVLGVSAGFDTYEACPLADVKLTRETYLDIGHRITETGLKRFALLEGEYTSDLPLLIENFIQGFGKE